MNLSEQTLVSYIAGIKDQKPGVGELHTDVDGRCADIVLDARYALFTSECIFDDCDETQVKMFLIAFLAHNLSVGWSVSVQLSKLLSSRGLLVGNIADPLMETLDWSSCGIHQLFLSYLAVHRKGAALAEQLLDRVPEDCRDGLFLACHKLQSEKLDRKLIAKFMEWGAGPWSPGATGELYALEQFIAKWLRLYSYMDLEGVVRLYFNQRGEE